MNRLIMISLATSTLLGCSAAELQELGRDLQEIAATCSDGQATCPDEEDSLLGVLGTGVEAAGAVKEVKDYWKGNGEPPNKAYIDGPIIQDRDGHIYREIRSPYTQKVWLDRNLGAYKRCASNTDSGCFGDYFQWGRAANGHEYYDSAVKDAPAEYDSRHLGNRSFLTVSPESVIRAQSRWREFKLGWADGESLRNPCPQGFRLPTPYELEREIKADRNNEFLKLAWAGYRTATNGKLHDKGNYGSFWTGWYGYQVRYDATGVNVEEEEQFTHGRSVRCTSVN